ncbi:N(G),N(G)-dimethylarginine dimethylaminohydrolase 1-like isoform X1 [Amphiura filiformis]|uniref:N(G),N(G)-dimethylarginine dimethylaminohydrolase 1-like isoform X1 n=1 Tax=Amphiura filiformis TaxID=82378 RepID=UPI003B21CC83
MASPAKKVTYSTTKNGQGNFGGGGGAMNSRSGDTFATQAQAVSAGVVASYFDFPAGIIRRIPDSLADQALRMDDSVVVDIDLARRQHEKLIMTLRKLNVGMSEMEPDEELPDCCFVEDPAVVLDGIAIIANMSQPGRANEVIGIRRILKDDLRQRVVEMKEDQKATLDGGDVLFTGREFFVGISRRTNQAGASFLAKIFSDYNVSSINVYGALHLKSMMSMAGPDIIAVGSSDYAQRALKQIIEKANHDYKTVTLPDDDAANCLFVKKTLIHCTQEEYPDSYKIFTERFRNVSRVALPNSELKKVDGGLTCRALLVLKTPKILK